MSQAVVQIAAWGQGHLAYWEKYLLGKILSGISIGDEELKRAKMYFLQDIFIDGRAKKRPDIIIPRAAAQVGGSISKLNAITDNKNINRLVDGQRLEFSRQVTAIYGDNGAGKSGYARLLACAGLTKGERLVLPDITKPGCTKCTPEAIFHVNDPANGDYTIAYKCDDACPDLAFVQAFDTTSVMRHLEKNEFTFVPSGLDALDKLISSTDSVREMLRVLIRELSPSNALALLFEGETEVSVLMRSLGSETDLDAIERFASVTNDERELVETLSRSIEALRKLNIPSVIEAKTTLKTAYEALKKALDTAASHLSDEVERVVVQERRSLDEALATAKATGAEQFKSDHFFTVGSQAWQSFVGAAKVLAEAEEQHRGEPYPKIGDRCLLCDQPLSNQEAIDRFKALWKYMQSKAQEEVEKQETKIVERYTFLSNANLSFYGEETLVFKETIKNNNILHEQILSWYENCEKRMDWFNAILRADKNGEQQILTESPATAIQSVIDELSKEIESLGKLDPRAEIKEKEAQLLVLHHRIKLFEVYRQARTHVLRARIVKGINKAIGTTAQLSTFRGYLFKELAAKGYEGAFLQFLQGLGREFKIKPEYSSKKPYTFRELKLEIGAAEKHKEGTVSRVLSEGEKRAVALADFLAEMCIDTSCNTIVLDDPSTSLDIPWKEEMADTLSLSAHNRQIIIFTHDLQFLYFLNKSCEEHGVAILNHMITREGGDTPGYVHLDNCPQMEKDYKTSKRVDKILQRIRDGVPIEDVNYLIKQGFGALRTCYEALIVYGVFGGTVQRFEKEIKPRNLEYVVADKDILDKIIYKHGILSGALEGHLPVEGMAREPNVEDLKREKNEFDLLKSEIKKRCNVKN